MLALLLIGASVMSMAIAGATCSAPSTAALTSSTSGNAGKRFSTYCHPHDNDMTNHAFFYDAAAVADSEEAQNMFQCECLNRCDQDPNCVAAFICFGVHRFRCNGLNAHANLKLAHYVGNNPGSSQSWTFNKQASLATQPPTTQAPAWPDCSGVSNCNSHGQCVDTDSCQCDSGWALNDCSLHTCFGVDSCLGQGDCIGPNICRCYSGWEGPNCSGPVCDGSLNGCNGNGQCVNPEQCSCNSGWLGYGCDQPDCSSLNDCGGPSHGRCEAPNSCGCFSGWGGSDCSDVIPLD